jgi:flagellar motility protein MotE (MotC chaperone)
MSNIRYYNRRIRILPVTIASLCLLLVAKIYDIYETGNQFSQMFLSTSAVAQEKTAPPKKESDKKEEPAKKEPESLEISPKKEEEKAPASEQKEFSEIEVDILQSLSKRREELEKMEEEVRMKESLLEATDVRLDEKIEQIKDLEKVVRDLLTAYDKEEEAKIASLVKIYENMKPKEAARIFDELDMSILLMVVDRMAERRAAPILAKMSPLKAKVLTEELAEDRKLRTKQEDKLNQIAPQQPPAP